jgi:hypothetical protein
LSQKHQSAHRDHYKLQSLAAEVKLKVTPVPEGNFGSRAGPIKERAQNRKLFSTPGHTEVHVCLKISSISELGNGISRGGRLNFYQHSRGVLLQNLFDVCLGKSLGCRCFLRKLIKFSFTGG